MAVQQRRRNRDDECELITRNAIVEGMVYLQITRGIADRDFAFPAGITSSIVAFASVLNLINNPAAESGIPVITTPDLRWKRRDIKSVNLLGQVLAKQDAYARGGKEGWMIEDGVITEGVSSSAYIVKDKVRSLRDHFQTKYSLAFVAARCWSCARQSRLNSNSGCSRSTKRWAPTKRLLAAQQRLCCR